MIFGRRRTAERPAHRSTHRATGPAVEGPAEQAQAPAQAPVAVPSPGSGPGSVAAVAPPQPAAVLPHGDGPVTGTGRVLTREGWPVPGASVTLLGGDGRQLGRAVSASDGGIRVPGLVAGTATLLVTAPGHAPRATSVVVPAGPAWSMGDVQVERQGGGEQPPPGIWVLDVAHSTVSATAHHLGLAAVHGRFTSFAGVITVPQDDVKASMVEVEIDASSIDTGNAQRDEHLRSGDLLDTANHPTLRFVSTGVGRGPDGRDWTLDGLLTMAGTTRPVQLALTYNGSGPDPWGGTRAAFSASTELHRDDFRMNWNQAVDIGVSLFGTTLKISIDVEAVLQT